MFCLKRIMPVVCLSLVFALQADETKTNKKPQKENKLFQGGRILTNSQKAEMIMKEANKSSAFVFHSIYTKKLEDGNKLVEDVWKKKYPDGTSAACVQTKQFNKDGKEIYKRLDIRQTDSSFWTVIKKKALKNLEMTDKIASGNRKVRAISKFIKYSYEDIDYNGIPCYKVSVVYPPHKAINGIVQRDYIIDKNDFFIYKSDEYNSKGKVKDIIPQKIEKLKFSEVNDTLFKIPDECNVIEVNSQRKFDFLVKTFEDSTLHPKIVNLEKKMNHSSCCGD